MSENSIMTVNEASRKLGVGAATVRWHIREGNLEATKFGTDWLITEEALKALRHRTPGPVPGSHRKKSKKK